MGKIDIDKFVASVMKCLCKPHREEAYLCKHWITEALDAQGLMFKDGKIVEVEGGEETFDDEKIRKRLLTDFSVLGREEWGGLKVKDICAWLEKQGKQKNKINSYKITFEDVLALECSMKTAKITEGGDKLYEILVPLYNKIHNAYLAEKQGELPEGCVRKQVAKAKEALYTAEVESEDEKMISALLEGFKYHQLFHPMFGGVPETEIISWLEKQKDTNVLIQEASEKAYTEGMRAERKHWLEKQREKKSIDDLTAQEAMDIAVEKCFEGGKKDPCEDCSCAMLNCTHFPCDKKKEFDGEKVAMATMDKVKPKFKVGDFILNGDVTTDGKPEIFKIRNVCSDWYNVENIYDSRPSILTFTQEWSCRLWSITDAKDGDVLIDKSGSRECLFIFKETKPSDIKTDMLNPLTVLGYCGIGGAGFTKGDGWGDTANCIYYPATKEQRELLFKEMRKSGYRWDADKKELEKIVIDDGKDEMDYCFTKMMLGEPSKNSEWSEEDEENLNRVIGVIERAEMTSRIEQYKDILHTYVYWLKSLKNRLKG